MRTSFFSSALARLGLASLAGCALITGCAAAGASAASPADAALARLLDADLDARAQADPVQASIRGDRRFDERMPDVSPDAIARRLDAARARLSQLRALDRAALSDENRLNARLLERTLATQLERARFHPERSPITQQNGVHISLPQLPDRLSFTREQHYVDYAKRLEAIPAHLEQTIANMREGLAAGDTPPRIVMRGVVEQARAAATDEHRSDPASHPLYAPFRAPGVDDPLAQDALRTIREDVIPAFDRLTVFLEVEYIPGCRSTIAADDLPEGEARYAAALRRHTTTNLTAREVHEIGLREVARIKSAMFETIARSDFPRKDELAGDALFRAFVDYLRTSDRFHYSEPAELLTGYRDICKRMDAELPRLFGKLPRLSYGVRAMPAFMSAGAPTAYYYPGSLRNGVSGTFIANTSALDQRPTYEMTALALHEAVPGHHLQIALKQELEDAGLHEWRTIISFSAFTEGWGLYAERLGLEVGGGERGFYSDPYDDFGRLSYEMWRALRLVVDTGIHALGWSRERAIDSMLDNSALTRANVVSEVDRYIAWPGQACAYKIGELKIRELRAAAEQALGERFDIRAFHDALLQAGPLPLDVLDVRMRTWIGMQSALPPSPLGGEGG